MIGRRFGGAVVLRLIGAGGMGAVYEAANPLLGTRYAIKVVLPELAGSSSAVERFLQEAKAVAAVSHPRLVSLIDCGYTEDGRPFQVMPLLDGQDLDSHCEQRGSRGRLDLAAAGPLFFQILDGLSAAHDRQIVHRDLKGANIHVLDDGTVKILDFGIAKLLDPSLRMVRTGSLQIIGTPGYMSPEQARGGPVDYRTDIWALGAVFFRVLTGRLPFEGNDPIEVVARAMLTPAPTVSELVPKVPARVSDVLSSCIAPDPDHRPDSVRALAHSLMAAIPAGRSVAASVAPALLMRSQSSDPTLRRPPSRGPVAALARAAGRTLSLRAPPGRRLRRPAALLVALAATTAAAALVTCLANEEPGAAPPVSSAPGPVAPSGGHTAPCSLSSKAGVGTLTITATPWAAVRIDGKRFDATPLTLALPAGPHRIELARPAGGAETVRVIVDGGRTTVIDRTWSDP